ncbi:MAG: hypothetical protein AABY18_02825 [Candidatus Thermoplasmatota archaeon]
MDAMASWRRSSSSTSPLITTLFLIGSAVVLAGGFYFAREIANNNPDAAPNIGIWSDDGSDRLLVVLGDPDADWQDVEVRTDVPARVRLDGHADALHGTLSPGTAFVPLATTGQQVVGGDALSVCALGAPGAVEITLRHATTQTLVFQQTMSVQACALAA